jgi:acyl dehydratase
MLLPPLGERYFEDYMVGLSVRTRHELVTRDDIVAFAAQFDPQYIHLDDARAQAGPFAGLIASGWHTAAVAMKLYVTEFLNDRASLASPGVDELRWPAPVRSGDLLHAEFVVLEARPSASRPDRGIVRTRITLSTDDDRVVMTMVATNFVLKRPD